MHEATRVVVLPGDGLVARFPGIVCVVRGPAAEPVRRLLEVCREASGPEPGRVLAQRLATWLARPDGPGDGLEFGTLAAAGRETAVFLHGAVTAVVGTVRLAGDRADRLVAAGGAARVVLDGTGHAAGPAPILCDLRDGVVPGGGAELAAPAVAPPAPPPTGHTVNALPTAPGLPAVSDPATGPLPRAPAPEQRTDVLATGPRALGRLVFDDGAEFVVDAEYVVGRLPGADERVRSGALRPIVVHDSSGEVSRVHAEVRVDGRDVLLVDSGSRNGTFVSDPADPAWVPVPPGRSRRLRSGTRVRMGARSFVFESA